MNNIIRRTELIGMPVIEVQNGRKIGEIKDILFNNQNGIVKGFIIIFNHWIKRQRILTRDYVVMIGQYSLLVQGCINTFDLGHGITQGRDLIGVKLVKEDGYQVGTVSDIFMDKKDWILVGYELSTGIIDDFIYGRSFLRAPIPYGLDNNILVVANNQYGNIRYYENTGIKNIFFNTIK
ncbi:MAG TPA: hypothetical protein GX392_04520 [Clostridiales bacterium]|nr:hypothetical protein [Clostridiales bacterium]